MTWIGKVIRDLRHEQGVSLVEVAAWSDLSTRQVSKIERGHVDGNMRSIEALLDALGYELEVVPVENGEARRRPNNEA